MAWIVFHVLWIINALTYVFITAFVLMMDWVTGRHAWIEGIAVPRRDQPVHHHRGAASPGCCG